MATPEEYQRKQDFKYLKGMALNAGFSQGRDPKEKIDLAKEILKEAIEQDVLSWTEKDFQNTKKEGQK